MSVNSTRKSKDKSTERSYGFQNPLRFLSENKIAYDAKYLI
jgi:hypothetical protein